MPDTNQKPKHPTWRAMHADTAAWAERVQLQFFREAPAWRKLAMAAELTKGVLSLSEKGLKARHPELTQEELRFLQVKHRLGDELAQKVYGCSINKAVIDSTDDF